MYLVKHCPHSSYTHFADIKCRYYRHATKIINHHSKVEPILKLTFHSQLLQSNFSPEKNVYLVNDEVRAGCPAK